jgi:predicted permease
MRILLQDLRYAVRQLLRNSGFTVAVVLTLALGIGVNTGIFSVVRAVLLTPLHYSEPDRLVMVWENNPRFQRVWGSYPNFQDWERNAHSFQSLAAFRQQEVDLTAPGTPSHLDSSQISGGFFSTLGLQLALGREFTRQEDQHGGMPVAVISNHLWRERFGGRNEVLGKTVSVNGVSYYIVGVAPLRFRLVYEADVYTPLGQLDPLILNDRAAHDGLFTLARLKAGVSLPRAQAEMSSIQIELDRLHPTDDRDLGIYLEPLKQAIVGDAASILTLLLGAVGLVLLIACANVANLMLAQSAARDREFAIRLALGASRARMVRQLLTESVLLSLAGGSLGIAIAFLGVRSVLTAMPDVLPRTEDVRLNAAVLLYTLVVSLVVGILFGLAPALKSWCTDPQTSLKDRGHSSTVGHRRTLGSFMVIQVSFTLVLLVSAGLLLRTVLHLWNVNPGFDTKNVITFKVGVSHSLTKTPSSTRIVYQRLMERIRQVPGVQAADFTTALPLTGQGGAQPFWLDGRRPESLQAAPRLQAFLTGPDYLRAMGIPLLQGRFVSIEDTIHSPCVAVIDSQFAHKFFGDGKPIGHTITAGFEAFGPCTIVGVAAHVKGLGLDDAAEANQYQTYYSLYQDPDQWVMLNYPYASIVVLTPLDAAALIPAIKATVYEAASDQPIYHVQTMRQIVADSMSEQRFPMMLVGAFAVLALLLAAVGIYGMVAYSVTQRVPEIGIRMALGATKTNVMGLFMRQQMRLVLAGIAIGALAAWTLARMLSSLSHLLYGIGPNDPVTFVTVSFAMLGIAAVACYIPARRAAKVDPVVTLRSD